jgi:hypothetical protein
MSTFERRAVSHCLGVGGTNHSKRSREC